MRIERPLQRVRVYIKGVVQGVGFRPFVYRCAVKHTLNGFVCNDSTGVVIEVEGSEENLKNFLHSLQKDKPSLSRIDTIQTQDLALQGTVGFEITDSRNAPFSSTMISPDISLCKSCEREMSDPNDKRYAYPFINCTDCGPRYTIISTLPYDRKNTSMQKFTMCKECKKEYQDPTNRRYHAEPVSCPNCGPKLYLLDNKGKKIAQEEALQQSIEMIKEGRSIVIKGLGGFHIVCDATSDDAIELLRQRKERASKPFAVMFRSMDEVKKHAFTTQEEEQLISSKERPIVVVKKKNNTILSELIAPGIDRIGVFLPYTPLHKLFLEMLATPLIATSANLSDAPIIIDESEVLEKLGNVVDGVLSYDREILNGCDDSVVQMAGNNRLFLRSSRGYTPKSLPLKINSRQKVLALGANQKNTLAFSFDGNIVLSPHIGDLNSMEAFEYYTKTLDTFQRIYNFQPEIVVCDKHPQYQTTKWAKELCQNNVDVKLIQVQHHYAHALACMAEYGLEEKVLAFCFDGTGYGDDGSVWGGEVFIADRYEYERVYHLKPFSLLGGEKAVKEPKRIALALLFECFTLEEILELNLPTVKAFSDEEITNLHLMWQRKIGTVITSSFGRVFDAVASLAGVLHELDYEGQSGLFLESLVKEIKGESSFSYSLKEGEIDITPMIKEMAGIKSASKLAERLIVTVIKVILDIASLYPYLPVILSGGVFQNRVLVELLTSELQKQNKKFYIQKDTPVNDASIALGQIYYALNNQGKL